MAVASRHAEVPEPKPRLELVETPKKKPKKGLSAKLKKRYKHVPEDVLEDKLGMIHECQLALRRNISSRERDELVRQIRMQRIDLTIIITAKKFKMWTAYAKALARDDATPQNNWGLRMEKEMSDKLEGVETDSDLMTQVDEE